MKFGLVLKIDISFIRIINQPLMMTVVVWRFLKYLNKSFQLKYIGFKIVLWLKALLGIGHQVAMDSGMLSIFLCIYIWTKYRISNNITFSSLNKISKFLTSISFYFTSVLKNSLFLDFLFYTMFFLFEFFFLNK